MEEKLLLEKNGARLYLSTFDASDLPGAFILRCPKNEACTDYVDLQGYSTGVLTWGGKHVIRLVESSKSGTNWYRKYSDGWIEQGGLANKGTISLLTPFTDTNYTCVATCTNQTGAMGTDSDTGAYVKSKTKTNFYASIGYQIGDNSNIAWYACGY